ncbi:MAG TPA: VOC family protein [Gemmatimonadales bacterium]|nr:VOC family protein [Gemmatimonadales bacterium]
MTADGQRLDHVGFVAASIRDIAPAVAQSTGTTWNGEIIHDPLQGVNVTFLRGSLPHEPSVELVEPVGPESPVSRFLARGGGFHHLCYEVSNLEQQLTLGRSNGALVVRPPLPAVAFGGRRIAWVYTRQQLLLEFLERAPGEAGTPSR